jgi:rhamnogalacturonan acetylesterase
VKTAYLSLALLLATCLSAAAQQTMPDDSVARPARAYKDPELVLDPKLPTLFIIGDSTARVDNDGGWGDHIAHYFDLTKINIANRARAGRSSRTFITEGAWDLALARMKAGDYVLIQMGHNDGGELTGSRPRGTLKGIGDDSQVVTLADGSKETVHTFGWYIRKYIADTRAKGATPILLSLTIRNIWTDGHIERDMGYDGYIHQIAEAEKVAFVDMATVAADGFEKLGQTEAAKYFPVDHTHTSAAGAELNAQFMVEALKQAKSPLVRYMAAQ